LILDEPTNDLDLSTVEVLEEMLGSYRGLLLVVSHDRSFMEGATEDLLVLPGDGSVQRFQGQYSDYLRQQQSTAAARYRWKHYNRPRRVIVGICTDDDDSQALTTQVPARVVQQKVASGMLDLQTVRGIRLCVPNCRLVFSVLLLVCAGPSRTKQSAMAMVPRVHSTLGNPKLLQQHRRQQATGQAAVKTARMAAAVALRAAAAAVAAAVVRQPSRAANGHLGCLSGRNMR
jgi:hypothetical protein